MRSQTDESVRNGEKEEKNKEGSEDGEEPRCCGASPAQPDHPPPNAGLVSDDLTERWESMPEEERMKLIGYEPVPPQTHPRPKARPVKYVKNLVQVSMREIHRQVDSMERGLHDDEDPETMKERVNWWDDIKTELSQLIEAGDDATKKWMRRIKEAEGGVSCSQDKEAPSSQGEEHSKEDELTKAQEKEEESRDATQKESDESDKKSDHSEDEDADIPLDGEAVKGKVEEESEEIKGMDIPSGEAAQITVVRVMSCKACGALVEIDMPMKFKTDDE